jgi:cell division ATPase FtsA
MLFSSQKRDASHRNFLMVDIGSASIGAALVSHKQGDRSVIIASHRVYVSPNEVTDYTRIVTMMSKALEEVLQYILKKGNIAPKDIVVTLRSPWTASQTRILHTHNKLPFVFTKKLADELIQKEIDAYHKKEMKEFAEHADDHVLLEHKTMRVKLNGYTVSNPLGKKTRSVDMASFISIIPQDIEQQIRNRIEHVFHTRITMHSFMFAVYTVVRNTLQGNHDSLIIDVGGDVTEIGVVRDEVLLQTASFPLGHNHVLRALVQKFSITFTEARSLLGLYEQGALSEVRNYEVAPCIKKAGQEWRDALQDMVNDLSHTARIPDVVFLSADTEMSELFKKELSEDIFSHYTQSHRLFTVVPLDMSVLKGHVVDQEERKDTFLIVATLFATMFIHRASDQEEDYLL